MKAETIAPSPLTVTKERLKEWSACSDGYRWFLGAFPQGAQFGEAYEALREAKRHDDADWLREHVFAELGTVDMTRAMVEIAGANKDKIAAKVAEYGGTVGAAATTGSWAPAATTGSWAPAATTGEGAPAATTGYRAPAATTGEGAPAATTGYRAPAAAIGKNSVAACIGQNSKAQAGENGAIVVAWWEAKTERPRLTVGYVGENGIKAETWYEANAKGELVEARA